MVNLTQMYMQVTTYEEILYIFVGGNNGTWRAPISVRDESGTHWSGSNVEFEKITQANNLNGCLGIGLRYLEILEFKSKDGDFPNYDHIRFYFMKKLGQ